MSVTLLRSVCYPELPVKRFMNCSKHGWYQDGRLAHRLLIIRPTSWLVGPIVVLTSLARGSVPLGLLFAASMPSSPSLDTLSTATWKVFGNKMCWIHCFCDLVCSWLQILPVDVASICSGAAACSRSLAVVIVVATACCCVMCNKFCCLLNHKVMCFP